MAKELLSDELWRVLMKLLLYEGLDNLTVAIRGRR